jgi:hypothetical protein
LSSLGVSETKKPAAPKPAAPKPIAKNPTEEPTNLVENPAMAEIAPELYSLVSGVDIPKTKEIEKRREVNKYAASPEFFVAPYKDDDEAVNAYKQTADFNLRHKNASDYTPDDIIKVQSYLDEKGYYPETKKLIKIEDYQTPEQIIELQKYLVKEGLIDVLGVNNNSPDGELSGKLDKNTRAAIEQYNMYNKKFKQGELDASTKEAIRQFQNKTDAKARIGVTVADPFELYDPKTGEPNVELTNKAMQKFEEDLMKRGFFTGNVKYDISSKAIENPRIAFKFTLNDDPTTAFGHCAQYVNGTVCKEDVVGEEAREELGFKGSAWQISENLQNKGGSLVFTGLPERSQIKLGDANEISNYLKTTLTSADAKNSLQEMVGSGNIWKGSSVKPGDVVNIFFEGSSYTKEAYNQTAPLNNRFFTTHVGIVKADDEGNLYVEHNVHGKVEKDKIQDFVDGKVSGNGKNKVSLIAGITRPNYFDGVDNDGRIPAAGMPYYQTEYGQFNPQGALANESDYAAKSVSGENTYKFLSTIEKNKNAILKDIPITENEFGKLMRVARVIPTLETYSGNTYEEPNVIAKGLQDALMPDREKSMGITSLKDETNINAQLRSKLYESDYDLADPVKAGLPTFYVLSKNYLYLKEVANEYGLDMTSDQLAKLAGISYNQSIGKVAAQLIEQGGYDNYINYRRANASKGDGKFQYHEAVDLYDKQTMKYGGWLNKYQGNEGSSQVKPTSNFTLPSLDPQAQQSADYAKGWEDYNAGVRTWTELLQEKEEKKGRALTTEEKQRWLQKAVKRNDGRKTEVDSNDPKWNFLFKDSYQTWDPEFGPMTVMSKPVDVTYERTELDKEKARIAAQTRKAEVSNPFNKSLGDTNELTPARMERASQNANDQVALRILNDKPQGDKNRLDWLNTLTPEERSTIERSQYAGKLDPDYTSQFSQGLEKNLRNVANIAAVGPIDWYQGKNVINQPLWTNSDYTQEEAANASAMGVLAPLNYPANLMTGAITGDFGSTLQGRTSMPLFTDYRQPEFASTMSGLAESIYDPMNAVGIGLLEGTNIAGNAARTGRYLNNKYLDIAEGANPFDYAWRSPAARFDNAAIASDEMADVLMPTSQKHFDDISSRLNLTDEERKILKEYEYDSRAFTGRGSETIDKNKRAILDDILKRAEIETSNPLVMSRRVDASNPELFKRVGNKIVFDRPTSWSAGRDALGNNVRAERSPDRIVTKLPSGKNKVLKNPYEALTDAQIEEYKQSLRAKGYSEDNVETYANMFNTPRVSERELLLGANSQFKQIGKVKNKIGGYDYIVKPIETPKQLPGFDNVDDLVDLWRIQERGARPMSELAAEGKLGPMFQNEKAIQHFKDREKYFGQWFTKDKADFDFYKADREFVDPEIIQLQVPKSKLAEFQKYDKTLSRAADREFVIPLDQQKLFTPKQLPGSDDANINNAIITKFVDDTNENVNNLGYLEGEKAIETIRKRKLESWKTEEGRRRLQKLIDNTSGLENETPDTFIKRMEIAENKATTRRTAKTKIAEIENQIDAYFTELNGLNKLIDEGKISALNYTTTKSNIENKIAELGDLHTDQLNLASFPFGDAAYVTRPTSQVAEIYLDDYANSIIDLPYTAAHEVSGHSLNILPGKSNPTYLDEKLAKLKLIDNASETQGTNLPEQGISKFYHKIGEGSKNYLKNAIDYFLTGSGGTEKVPFVTEVKEDMLLKGIIKNDYDEITPQMIKAHYESYKKTPGEKFSLRLYDIIKNDQDNFKDISEVLNNLPSWVAPAAIGTGAAAVIAGQDTPQQKDGGWINKYQKGGSNPEYYDIQSEMNNIRKNYETEYADIQRFKQNLLDSGESHFMDNVPFCTVLPNGQQYCATRATEALRKSGYPVKQISSGRKLKDELTPDKGWYPTKYENLEAGDVAMIERPGYWHTMVSSGNVSNVDSRIRRNATDTQKGFFYDSGSGKDWTFEIPKDEEELANWMNPKTMNYYSYQGKLPELESQYADYHNQLKALPFPYIQPRAPQPLQVPQPVLQNNQKQEFEKGGSLSKNKYINSVTLSNTSSWLNKYK